MRIGFFDEFGHSGPFISRAHPIHGHSPVFGLAGMILPHIAVRPFATNFLQLKEHLFAYELKKNGRHPATWEKKGAELFTSRNIKKYPHIREGVSRLIRRIDSCGGRIIYYGRIKFMAPEHSNPSGLYTTVLGHLIRACDEFCLDQNDKFMLLLDQHSDRKRLLETAAKTMFSVNAPARCLIEPPFHVESHLYQTIQAADWISTLVGRIQAYRALPSEYSDWDWADKYFGKDIGRLTTHSRIWKPKNGQRAIPGLLAGPTAPHR